MVCEWGMSDKLGPLAYEKREGPVFLGMQQAQSRDYSDSKAQEIDSEVFKLVKSGHDKAIEILETNMQALHNMAGALLEYETIDSDEVNLLVEGGTLEALKTLRGNKREQIERERKVVAERQEKADKEVKKKSSDPVGQTGGPVGSPA
jgi:cell division protease FtsH